MVHIGCKNAVI